MLAVVASTAALASCGGSGSSDVLDTPQVDTSTFVGTWGGLVDGGSDPNSYGSSRTTTILRADSTMSGTAENPNYCPITGTWSVSATEYSHTARDCGGTLIRAVAPRSPTRLTGTWTAGSGRSGTFTMAKLP